MFDGKLFSFYLKNKQKCQDIRFEVNLLNKMRKNIKLYFP